MKTQYKSPKHPSSLLLGIPFIMAFFFLLTACSPKDSFNGKGVNIHKIYWRGKSSVNTVPKEPFAVNLIKPNKVEI